MHDESASAVNAASAVAAIMSKRIVTVELDDSLKVVREILESTKLHHVLAVEDGHLYGVVSDRDLLRALSPYIGSTVETSRDLATLDKRVHQIMTRHPITVLEDASIESAARLMLESRISCIPVVDHDSKPIGIVTWRDILRHLVVNPSKPADV